MAIQRGLGSLKFDAGPADGMFGNKTRGAIKNWQQAKGFDATGYLTRDQAEALRAVARITAKAVGTLTISTVPSDAKVRVFTTAGTAYRDGMDLQAGEYEVVVEAQGHEPLRRRLAVEGPTAYRISLCKLETRTKRVCSDQKEQRYRVESRESVKSMTEKDTFYDIWAYDNSDETYCENALEKLRETLHAEARLRGKGSINSYKHSPGLISLSGSRIYMTRKCEKLGGSLEKFRWRGRPFHAKTTCSCGSPRGEYHKERDCKVSMRWQCRYNEDVKVPYMATETVCRDQAQTERVCPDNIAVRLR